MKKMLSFILVTMCVLLLFAIPAAATAELPELLPPSNPIIKAIYTADPSAHVWPTNPNKLYLYPSHDMDPANGCDYMNRYHVYSTEDMVNWVDEGEILNSDQVAWGREEGGFMWAPDAAYKDGTYYFYYPHPTPGEPRMWQVGVATSKYPNKGFIDKGLIKGAATPPADSGLEEGASMIDPQVFIDDDGTAYYFVGGSQRLWFGVLNDDMVTMKVALSRIPSEQVPSYHEGPWVFKRNGIYYLTYPGDKRAVNGKTSDHMLYSTSNSIYGPWTPRGTFHLPVNTGDTSHGSVVEFKGHWYLFYHNSEVYSSTPGNTTGNLRSVCVDELYFNEDGTIKMVEQTATGPAAVGTTPAPDLNMITYPASSATLSGGASLSASDIFGQVIGGLTTANSTATFNGIDGGLGGRGTIKIRYSSEARRAVRLIVNGYDWSYINLPSTGGMNEYTREAVFTVTNLLPGKVNTIQLVGRASGSGYTAGAANIAKIDISLFNDYDEITLTDTAKFESITATSPLAVGSAANVLYEIRGENLAGKPLWVYVMGYGPFEVIPKNDTYASGIASLPASWMKRGPLSVKEDTDFQVAVKARDEKDICYGAITLMPTDGIWTVWSENKDGKLLLKFNTDISGSTNLDVKVEGVSYPSKIETKDSILVDVDFDSLTVKQDAIGEKEERAGSALTISRLKYPMFLSYTFAMNAEVMTIPDIKYYSVALAALGGTASRSNNNSSPTGVVVENMHNAGAYIEWTISDIEKAGAYVLGVDYSSGATGATFMVSANGAQVGVVNLPTTGGWNNFTGHGEITVNLREGSNTIRLSRNGSGANTYRISLQYMP